MLERRRNGEGGGRRKAVTSGNVGVLSFITHREGMKVDRSPTPSVIFFYSHGSDSSTSMEVGGSWWKWHGSWWKRRGSAMEARGSCMEVAVTSMEVDQLPWKPVEPAVQLPWKF